MSNYYSMSRPCCLRDKRPQSQSLRASVRLEMLHCRHTIFSHYSPWLRYMAYSIIVNEISRPLHINYYHDTQICLDLLTNQRSPIPRPSAIPPPFLEPRPTIRPIHFFRRAVWAFGIRRRRFRHFPNTIFKSVLNTNILFSVGISTIEPTPGGTKA